MDTTTYPRRTDTGATIWACCESTIGPPCGHKVGGKALVELAHLTGVEYRARVLLDACHRTLAAIPEGEQTDADRAWAASMYRSWVDAWEDLDAFRRELKAGG